MSSPLNETNASDSKERDAEATPLSRRERRKLELRARILEVASALFFEQGFHETRVAEICEQADIADKTFFNHFPSKLHLLRELSHQGIEQLLLDIEEIRKADHSTPDRLRHFFETVAEHISIAGPKSRELFTELVHVMTDDEGRPEQVERLHAAFGAVVEDGQAQGDVTRRHSVQTLTELILGAYYVLIFNYANLVDFPVRERAVAAANLLADALAPGQEEQNGAS